MCAFATFQVLHEFLHVAGAEARLASKERHIMNDFCKAAAEVGEAADAVLAAAEAQPQQMASPALIGAVCAAVPAHFGAPDG